MKEAEETLSKLTKERIRVVERSGRTIKSLLCVSDLWSDAPCGRGGCLSCEDNQGQREEADGEERTGRGEREGKKNKKMNCFQRSLVYEIHCCECQQKVDEHRSSRKRGTRMRKKQRVRRRRKKRRKKLQSPMSIPG